MVTDGPLYSLWCLSIGIEHGEALVAVWAPRAEPKEEVGWVPFYLGVVELRKQVGACKKLQRGEREMACFPIVCKPI